MKVTLRTLDGQEKIYEPFKRAVDEAIPCFRCGICCIVYQPKMDEAEARVIAQGLGLSFDSFVKQYALEYPPKSGIYRLRHHNGACIFLHQEGDRTSCSIQDFKPSACREWEPSLSRNECLEGLKKRGNGWLTMERLYPSLEEKELFYHSLRGGNE
jgi:hypothetical protein